MFVARRIGGLEMSIVYLQYFPPNRRFRNDYCLFTVFPPNRWLRTVRKGGFFYTKKPPAHSRGLFY
nr:MAG TPA: hypothetical protein [Caudoviricetes sp.]